MWFDKSRSTKIIGFLSILLFTSLPEISRAGHALLIAYPDYRVSTDKGSDTGLEVGHAGVLLISNTGVSNYYEFGCYDHRKEGVIRSVSLPRIRNGRPGVVDKDSVYRVLKKLTDTSGQRGRILGAYVPDVDYDRMYQFVQKSRKKWPDYHWYSNNCATYAAAVIRAGKPARAPWFNNAITAPEIIVRDFTLLGAGDVRFDPNRKTFSFRKPGGWLSGLVRSSGGPIKLK